MVGMMARSSADAAGGNQPGAQVAKPDSKQKPATDKNQNAAPVAIAPIPLPPLPTPLQTVAAPVPVTSGKEQPAPVVPGNDLLPTGSMQGLTETAAGKDQPQPVAITEKTAAPQVQPPVPALPVNAAQNSQTGDGKSILPATARTIPAPSVVHPQLTAGNSSKIASSSLPPASNGEHDAKAAVAAAPLQAAPPKPNQSLTRELSPLPPADGTVIARQDNRMKKDVNVDKSSQTAEQNLPSGKVSTSATSAEADTGGKQASPESTGRKPESLSSGSKPPTPSFESVAQLVRVDSKPAADEAQAPSARAPQAQKVLNDITDQVVTFKNVGVNSMDAVVRPDSTTAISLQLSLRNGQVEVAARVDRGNFEGLQTHWGELQTSLAQQGVRVGPLHQASLNNQTSSRTPSQETGAATGDQQQAPRRGLRSPQTLDELPLVGSVTEPLKAQPSTPTATARRGWEKWA